MRVLIFIWCFTISYLSVYSQQEYINFDIWEAQKTKVGSMVFDIYQDETGYIWLSTFNGVIRFDGSDFVHLADIYPEFDAIPGHHISCVRVDKEKRIWIGTIRKGLFMLDTAGKLHDFNDLLENSDELKEYRIQDICIRDSLLFIMGRTGLNTFLEKENSFQKLPNILSRDDQEINSILEFDNDLLFTTDNSILALNGTIKEDNAFSFPTIFVDKYENLWASSLEESGTLLYRYENGSWIKNEHQPLINVPKFRKYIWDYQNRIWGVKYNDNLICYDFQNKDWVIRKGGTNCNLDQRNIRCAMVDNSGTVWIGSDVISLFRKRSDIRSIKLPLGQNDDIRNFIIEDDRIIYSTGFSGARILNLDSEFSKEHTKNINISARRMVNMTAFANGNVGFQHFNGFQLMNEKDEISSLVPFRGSNRSSCFHRNFYWVGGVNKIVRIDPITLDTKKYKIYSEYQSQNIYINGLVPKSDTELYVGPSLLDVQVFNIEDEKFYPISHEADSKDIVNTANDLAISNSNLLANAGQRGLVIYDDEEITELIPRKYFNAVEWHNDSILLASTKDEIYKIDINNNVIAVFTKENGLLNTQFEPRSSFKTGDRICFGGNKGLDCIQSTEVSDTLSAVLNLESISVDGALKIDIQTNNDKIVLPPNTQHVSIKLNHFYTKGQDVASIIYKNKEENSWKRLEGNTLALNNLRNGVHEFEFKSDIPNYHGKTQLQQLSFEIPIPWYRQSWFPLIVVVALITLISWWMMAFQNRKKEKQIRSVQLKADIAELRLNALSGQMNPHFTFNALNSILQMINEQDFDNASVYIQKFSRILRFVLEYAEQSWVTMENEIKFLEDYLQLEQMRFNSSFDYSLSINNPNLIGKTSIPPFFIQPKIENALKHGIRGLFERGKIDISIDIEELCVKVFIRDNGIGREAAKNKSIFGDNHTNKGIELTKKRMEQLTRMGYESSLEIIDLYEENEPKGTEVRLILPSKSEDIKAV